MRVPPRVPAEIRTAAFPHVGRGYDRRAVDAYVTRVNDLIAELEATRSPETVLERAFERAEEQRRGMLREAREAAAEIIAAAEQDAREIIAAAEQNAQEISAAAGTKAVDLVVTAGDEAERAKTESDDYGAKAKEEAERILTDAVTEAANRLARAEEELEAMRKEAEASLRALRIDTSTVWAERRDLLEDLHAIAARLEQTAAPFVAEPGAEHDSSL
jgi:DivIVA domain-containing protein